MIEFHECPQGSQKWHEMRREHIGSSDAAVIMGCGYMTPLKLYENKLGLYEVPVNYAMRRGSALEEGARKLYNPEAKPAVVTNEKYPWAMASLDGITPNGRIVEIKTGGAKTEERIVNGDIPDNHYAQCQHILMVTEKHQMDYVFSTGSDILIHQISRDDEYINRLMQKERDFFERLLNWDAPDPEDSDIDEITDPSHLEIEQEYLEAYEDFKIAETHLKRLKDQLIERCEGRSMKGNSVTIRQQTRKGSVDYSKVEELKGVDLEKYRKDPTKYWVIR